MRGRGFGQITKCYKCRQRFASKSALVKMLINGGYHLVCSRCRKEIEGLPGKITHERTPGQVTPG